MLELKEKHWTKLYHEEKLSRKVKKAILGERVQRKKLRERIAKANISKIYPYENSYSFYYPDDNFCPECGCEFTRSTGNMAEYPEEWIKYYCCRCGAKVEERDNGMVWHALFDYKPEVFDYEC